MVTCHPPNSASAIHNIFLVREFFLPIANHVSRSDQNPIQTHVGFHSDCGIPTELLRIATVRNRLSYLRSSWERDTFSSLLVRDWNGGVDRLASHSGKEDGKIGPGLRTRVWSRAGSHWGRGWLTSDLRKLLFRVDLSDFRRGNWSDNSWRLGGSLRRGIAKRSPRDEALGGRGACRGLSRRVLNPLLCLRSTAVRDTFRTVGGTFDRVELSSSTRSNAWIS